MFLPQYLIRRLMAGEVCLMEPYTCRDSRIDPFVLWEPLEKPFLLCVIFWRLLGKYCWFLFTSQSPGNSLVFPWMKIQMIIMKSQQKKPHNASPHSKLFSIVVSTKKDAGSQEIAIYRETVEGQYSTNLVVKNKLKLQELKYSWKWQSVNFLFLESYVLPPISFGYKEMFLASARWW